MDLEAGADCSSKPQKEEEGRRQMETDETKTAMNGITNLMPSTAYETSTFFYMKHRLF